MFSLQQICFQQKLSILFMINFILREKNEENNKMVYILAWIHTMNTGFQFKFEYFLLKMSLERVLALEGFRKYP